MGSSPGAAVALTRMNAEIDVRGVLPLVRVPALVLHRRDDVCLRVEEGRFVASLIPGARFLELPGADHLPFVGDQEQVLQPVQEFLETLQDSPRVERVLATVMTLRSQDGGDVPAHLRRQLLREIDWFRGQLCDISACGPLAAFDGPARAVRCSISILEFASLHNAPWKIALHTGECDRVNETQLQGVAVEISAALAHLAEAGQILVTNTVKDLVAGSGLAFHDVGAVSLGRGLGDWQTLAVRR
jgi:hypothetical protein